MTLYAYSPWGLIPAPDRTPIAQPLLGGLVGGALVLPFPRVFPVFAGQASGPGGYEDNVAKDQMQHVQRITATGAQSYE